ncbi:kinase-like domain-containing protein [Gigaspora rosea]|uniref:Kinase-like domain-containing protein n=1 Tax=Gigaspora rosea TaxID=44941 RepID=A0A397W4D0_9GLOM|nr:kinase-like domain-containing protein [Gigaspora rosea]
MRLERSTNEWIHNSEIEDDLKKVLTENKNHLAWISYDEFKDIEEIGSGGFATVFYAKWHNLKACCDISLKDPTFLKFFGISKDKASKDYILVMEYASEGCLRNNLHNIAQMDWKDKLNLLQCIAYDICTIHSHGLIHRDLHSGNILQNSFKSAYIADLGLSITANIALKSKSDKICGILPYIAPEVLNKHPYTKASDVYSFGIIMWEILYGKPVPFELKSKLQSELQFQIQVCNGLRPHIYDDTAKCYADLMKKCWNIEPNERPTASEIYDIFTEWENNEIVLSELSKFDKKLLNVKKNDNIHEYINSHYKSCFISSNKCQAKIGTNYNNFKTISLKGISIQQFEIIINFQNYKLKKLPDWCNDIIAKYPDKIFESRDFINLQENALISLIIRDNLQIKEVKIWNNVIEWGIAQNHLPSDSKTWSQENFLTLKTTLRNLLPLVRYFQMSADDIIDSVRPYQQILGKGLWEDISTKFMSPNRHIRSTVLPPRRILTQPLPSRVIPQVTLAQTFIQPNSTNRFSAIIDDAQMSIIASSFSVIINNAQAAIIASLVDEKTDSYSVTNNPYEFKLLLRGTRDGFTAKPFWDLCNEQKNVVVVMKVEAYANQVQGGASIMQSKQPGQDKTGIYNPELWAQAQWRQTRNEQKFLVKKKKKKKREKE